MSDVNAMVERAAESLWLWSEMRREPMEKHRIPWVGAPEDRRSYLRLEARAALLAALDPEDEALVEAVARAIMALDLDATHSDWTGYRLRAVAATATMNRSAQGEPGLSSADPQ